MNNNKDILKMIPTPALLINELLLKTNVNKMQDLANLSEVNLRPHTKTHRTPKIAQFQIESGSIGITVATTGEAECMYESGIHDIFIANEIADEEKLIRLKRLVALGCDLKIGADNSQHIKLAQSVFSNCEYRLKLLVEIDVGDGRAGVQDFETALKLVQMIDAQNNLEFAGVFSHEGQSYGATTIEECKKVSQES
ncbi:MAG: alanine racemase, partial [bacterium]